MTRKTFLLCLAAACCFLAAGCGDDDQPSQDSLLRVNEIQCRGTHNSYHIARPLYGWIPTLQYGFPPLNIQLNMGARLFELDLWKNKGQGIEVHHIPILDDNTTCRYLTECLATIKDWSDEHPLHKLIFVQLEIKEDLDPWEIESEILSVWPEGRVFAPDDLTGGLPCDSLLSVIQLRGWPTLAETTNQIMFLLHDTGATRDAYVDGNPCLKGGILWPKGSPSEPFAAWRNLDDPVSDFEKIQDHVEQGMLIRTRADASCMEAYFTDYTRQEHALASGAQLISTDFLEPPPYSFYSFELPTGGPYMCNEVIAPSFCNDDLFLDPL